MNGFNILMWNSLNAYWHIKYHFSMLLTHMINLFMFSAWMKKNVFSSISMHMNHLLHFWALICTCLYMNSCLLLVRSLICHRNIIAPMFIWNSNNFASHMHLVSNICIFHDIGIIFRVEKHQDYPWITYWEFEQNNSS